MSQADDEVMEQPFVVRGNPFLRALLIVGVLVAVGGLWAQWASAGAAHAYFGGGGRLGIEDRILPLLLGSMAPWFTALGLGAVIAMLVLYAITWRPAR